MLGSPEQELCTSSRTRLKRRECLIAYPRAHPALATMVGGLRQLLCLPWEPVALERLSLIDWLSPQVFLAG